MRRCKAQTGWYGGEVHRCEKDRHRDGWHRGNGLAWLGLGDFPVAPAGRPRRSRQVRSDRERALARVRRRNGAMCHA